MTGYQNVEFRFIGTFADGTSQMLTDLGYWTCDNPDVLYVTAQSGMSNGQGVPGSTTVTGGQPGTMTGTASVTAR